MQPAFTIKEAIKYGWDKTVDHLGFLVLLTLGFFVFNIIFQKEGGAFFHLLNVLIGYYSMFIFIHVGLKIHRGERPTIKDVFDIDLARFGLYIVAAFLTMILITGGFILLIIPGILLAIRLSFTGFALVEDRLDPIESIKKSWALSRGRFWPLFGFACVLFLINIAGAIALGVGLLFTSPLCLLATVYVYKKLKEAPALVQAAAAAPTV